VSTATERTVGALRLKVTSGLTVEVLQAMGGRIPCAPSNEDGICVMVKGRSDHPRVPSWRFDWKDQPEALQVGFRLLIEPPPEGPGVTELDEVEAGPVPMALVAVTVKV
jgi:hypothetical protein